MGNIFRVDQICGKLSGFEVFAGLPKERIEMVLFGATVKRLKHREILYRSGEEVSSFSLVLDGALKIFRQSPRGEDVIVHFAVSGDLIGALVMNQVDNSVYPISAKSMGPSLVVSVPRSTYLKYWQDDPILQTKINRLLYSRMHSIQDDKALFSSPLAMRIANLLLRHLHQVGPDSDSADEIMSHTLTRQEIADSLGVAVESVIRTMRVWQEDGTITRKSDRSPEVVNVQLLVKKAEG